MCRSPDSSCRVWTAQTNFVLIKSQLSLVQFLGPQRHTGSGLPGQLKVVPYISHPHRPQLALGQTTTNPQGGRVDSISNSTQGCRCSLKREWQSAAGARGSAALRPSSYSEHAGTRSWAGTAGAGTLATTAAAAAAGPTATAPATAAAPAHPTAADTRGPAPGAALCHPGAPRPGRWHPS